MKEIRAQPRMTIVALALFAAASGCEDKHRYVIPAPTPVAEDVAAIRAGAAGGSGNSDVPQIDPTGWATIRGTIRLVGTPPANSRYSVTKELEVCAPGGVTPMNEVYLVGDDHRLANVVIFLKTDLAKGDEEVWIHESARPGLTTEVKFDQHNCVFDTRVLALQWTQTLRIFNSDSVGHNTLLKSEVSLRNVMVPRNDSVTVTFGGQDSKPFKVTCSIHGWMYSYMITRDNGYFDVTDTTGTFELPNLPAGVPLDIVFWHEEVKFNSAEIQGGEQTFSRTKITITLEPGAVYEWDISVPAS